MPAGERFRGTGATAIGQFLKEHRPCAAGFEVHRDDAPGSGRLLVRCKGCGREVDYRAADVDELPAGAGERANGSGIPLTGRRVFSRGHDTDAAGTATGAPTATAAGTATGAPTATSAGTATGAGTAAAPTIDRERQASAPPEPESRVEAAAGHGASGGAPPALRIRRSDRDPQRPRRASSWMIAAAVAGGLGLIVAGIMRSDDEQPADLAPPPAEQPEAPAPEPPAATPPGPAPAIPVTRHRFERFAVSVPRSWRRDDADPLAGFVPPRFVSPAGDAHLLFYFQSGGREPLSLAPQARGFLLDRHPGASVNGPTRFRLSGRAAARLTAQYDGGSEQAILLSAHGFTHVILARVADDATPAVRGHVRTALRSFKPR